MSQRRTTGPPTRVHTPPSASGRKGLIARTKKQSAKKRTVLDDRFHRTYHAFTRAAGSGCHVRRFKIPRRATHTARVSLPLHPLTRCARISSERNHNG